jgi:hypothetical protein
MKLLENDSATGAEHLSWQFSLESQVGNAKEQADVLNLNVSQSDSSIKYYFFSNLLEKIMEVN